MNNQIYIGATTYSVIDDSHFTYPTFDMVDKDKWSIRWRGDRLTKKEVWIYEPMPSSRTKMFYKRTQFDFDEGMKVYKKIIQQIMKNQKPQGEMTEIEIVDFLPRFKVELNIPMLLTEVRRKGYLYFRDVGGRTYKLQIVDEE